MIDVKDDRVMNRLLALQLLDEDGDPSNGIKITVATKTALVSRGDVRGARMAVTMRYQLDAASARPGGTRVSLVSDAELTGMLAEFAKTGGVVLANAVLADFAARLSAHFEARAAVVASALMAASTDLSTPALPPTSTPAATVVATVAPPTLSASTLAIAVLRAFAAGSTRAIARALARMWRALVGGRN